MTVEEEAINEAVICPPEKQDNLPKTSTWVYGMSHIPLICLLARLTIRRLICRYSDTNASCTILRFLQETLETADSS
jgi:hypothetical protein